MVAALNEELAIGPTLNEVNLFLDGCKCLVVDGHSIDQTVAVAKSFKAEVVPQDNLGKGDAIAKAVEYIQGKEIEYIGMIDADFTYPAKYFPLMIEILDKNPDVGMVCGNRFCEMEPRLMPEMFFIGNMMIKHVHRLVNGIKLSDPLTGLRVFRREVVDNWVPKSKEFDIEVELNSLVKKKGYSFVEIPIEYRRRMGEKKLKAKHGVQILMRMLQESYSD